MALRVVVFAACFVIGLLLSVERRPASAQRAGGGACAEAEAPRGAGLRSFCWRAERIATAPIERQFME